MTIPKETEASILRLHFAEKWRIGTIANHLHVHHDTVRRVLVGSGIAEAARSDRKSLLDPYSDFIDDTLRKYPRLHAAALYGMCRERGYPGRPDHFRHVVNLRRPRPPVEAFARLRTLPGEQAQVDWAHFGTIQIGQAVRPLVAFVMVLSWSRHLFLHFDLAYRMENFLRGHEAAFQHFEGLPSTTTSRAPSWSARGTPSASIPPFWISQATTATRPGPSHLTEETRRHG